jgi:hypothetical protein
MLTDYHPMTPPLVQPFYAAAQSYVKRALNLELDGSVESLAFVDHYVAASGKKESLKPEVLALTASALGAYFGELAIKRFGGRWVLDDAEPARWRVELEPAPLSFFPVGMAAEALRGDEVEGYDAGFTTRDDLLGPLEEALASSPPVDEAYYYSLTGRLETLQHALEILVEFERRRREKLS